MYAYMFPFGSTLRYFFDIVLTYNKLSYIVLELVHDKGGNSNIKIWLKFLHTADPQNPLKIFKVVSRTNKNK
jgi:hypothetical protein